MHLYELPEGVQHSDAARITTPDAPISITQPQLQHSRVHQPRQLAIKQSSVDVQLLQTPPQHHPSVSCHLWSMHLNCSIHQLAKLAALSRKGKVHNITLHDVAPDGWMHTMAKHICLECAKTGKPSLCRSDLSQKSAERLSMDYVSLALISNSVRYLQSQGEVGGSFPRLCCALHNAVRQPARIPIP